jgi:uncharacterized protein YndB with AHSA1/START domain
VEVTRELVLPAAPDEVWKELTDPDRLEEWFATEVELDLEQGEGRFRWENGEERPPGLPHVVVEDRLEATIRAEAPGPPAEERRRG